MKIEHPQCAGLDIHKKAVVACVMAHDQKHIRSFGPPTPDLLQLRDWLTSHGITHVAMEATGSYWKPVYNLLEDGFSLLVANASHMKAIPGHKTDVADAEWIADPGKAIAESSWDSKIEEIDLDPWFQLTMPEQKGAIACFTNAIPNSRGRTHPQGLKVGLEQALDVRDLGGKVCRIGFLVTFFKQILLQTVPYPCLSLFAPV